jgi:UDP-N-acetylmuramoyl-tripeptide--D-alanyl-D-alanine ligase
VLASRSVDAPAVIVPDTLAALGDLGRHARDRISASAVVAGITGSTGKTSTKDLAAGALAAGRTTVASPASFNNEIGAPLTLLGAPDDVEAIVVEMGARGIGHIAYLTQIARPTAGIITNIGVAHAELFGTIEETAKAKGELLEALPPSGVAIVNADDPATPGLVERTAAAVVRAGHDRGADVRVVRVELDDELRPLVHFATPWGEGHARLNLRGAHQATNAAMALALAGSAGVALDAALEGLAAATGSHWRLELARTPAGALVLNDSYNANPASVHAALDALAGCDVKGRRIAVLGVMAELGARTDLEHRRVGEYAAALAVDEIVAVGDAAAIAEAAREAGAHAVAVAGAADALELLSALVQPDDAVLVKASRAAGFERVAQALIDGTTELAP